MQYLLSIDRDYETGYITPLEHVEDRLSDHMLQDFP